MTGRRRMRVVVGVDEVLSNRDIWRRLMAEFVGTFFLVFVVCGSGIRFPNDDAPTLVRVSLTSGFAVTVLVQSICHVSGGHINPAVSFAMLVVGKISILRAIFYVLTQCVGAIVGAAVLHALTPDVIGKEIGVTRLHRLTTSVEGFGIEFLVTFVLLLTVFAVCDVTRSDLKGSASMAIGFAVAGCHLFAIPYTGCSMNPARSFGPAMMANHWEHQWIYWVGPCLGGIAGAMFYQCVLTGEFSTELPVKDRTSDSFPLMKMSDQDKAAATKDEVSYKTTAI